MNTRTLVVILSLSLSCLLTGCFGTIDSAALLNPGGSDDESSTPSFKILLEDNQNEIANTLPIKWKVEFDEKIPASVNLSDILNFNTTNVKYVIEETEERKSFLVSVYDTPFTKLNLNINTSGISSTESGKSFDSSPKQAQSIEFKQPFLSKGSTYHSSIIPLQEISKLSYVGTQDNYTVLMNKNLEYIRTKGTPNTTSFLRNFKEVVNYEHNGVFYYAENDPNDAGITKIYKAPDAYSEDRELVYNFNVIKAHRKGTHSLSFGLVFSDFFYSFRGKTLFIAAHTDGYLYLWTTDGTTAGTQRIFQLPELFVSNTYIRYGFVFDDGIDLYFNVETSEAGDNWYVTDGTASGTAYLGDYAPGTADHIYGTSLRVVLGNTFLYRGYDGSTASCYTLKNRVIAAVAGGDCNRRNGTPIIYGDNKIFWSNNTYSFFSFDGTTVVTESPTTQSIRKFFTLDNGDQVGLSSSKMYSFDKAAGTFTEVIDFDTTYSTASWYSNAFHFNNKIYMPADDGGGSGLELRAFALDGSHETVADLNVGAGDAFTSYFIGNVVGNHMYFYYQDSASNWNIAKVDSAHNVTSIAITGNFSLSTSDIPSPAFWGNGNEVFFTASNSEHSNELFRLTASNTLELLMNTNLDNEDIGSLYRSKSGSNYSMLIFSSGNSGSDLWRFNSSTNTLDNFSDPSLSFGTTADVFIHFSPNEQRWLFTTKQTTNREKLYITDGSTITELTGFDAAFPPYDFQLIAETKDYYYIEAREGSPTTDYVYSVRKSDNLTTKIAEANALQVNSASWRSYDFDYNSNELLFSGAGRDPILTDGTSGGTRDIGPASGSLDIDNSSLSVKILNSKYVIYDLFDNDFYVVDPADVENPTSVLSLVAGYTSPYIAGQNILFGQDKIYFNIVDGVSHLGEYYSFDGTNLEKVFDETAGLGNDYNGSNLTYLNRNPYSLFRGTLGNWVASYIGNYFSADGTAANSSTTSIPYTSINCHEETEDCTYLTGTNFIVADYNLSPTADWGSVPGVPKSVLAYDGTFAAVYNDNDEIVCMENGSSTIISSGTGETFSLIANRGSGKFLLKRDENSIRTYYNLDCSGVPSLTKSLELDEPNVNPLVEVYVNGYLLVEIGNRIYSVGL